MKVLVVGASGYLGGIVSARLADADFEVIAQIRKTPVPLEPWKSKMADVLRGDIRDESFVSALADTKPEAVVYCVSLNHKDSETSIEKSESVNVLPVWRLLNLLSKRGVRRFIYFSTQQVYGPISSEVIDETRETAPVNNYGLTHLMGEDICRHFNAKMEMECVSLRCSNAYGPPNFESSDCWWLALNGFASAAVMDRRISLLSDGTPQKDFVAAAEVADAVLALLKRREIPFDRRILNLGSGKTTTILELAYLIGETYREIQSEEIRIFVAGVESCAEDVNRDIDRFVYDIGRLAQLGFTPKTDLKSDVRKLLEYLIVRESRAGSIRSHST